MRKSELASGYDIRTQTGLEDTFSVIEHLIGMDQLKVFHLNDSKGDLGCRVD